MGRFLEAIGLKRQPPPSDPIFRFKKFYNFAAPYWEAEAEFATAGGSVEALVSCPRSGASPSQHSFFRDLEARYREALAAAHQAIGRELSTSAAGAVLPTADSLRLVCVSVPEAPPVLIARRVGAAIGMRPSRGQQWQAALWIVR